MVYHFKVQKDERGGYIAECLELEGCRTEADSQKKLWQNMQEALDLYLSEPMSSDIIFPFPKRMAAKKGILEVPVSYRVAFYVHLRYLRLHNQMTQKQVAAKLGYKSVNAYQKIESPTANPGLDTIFKLKNVFPELKIDKIFS